MVKIMMLAQNGFCIICMLHYTNEVVHIYQHRSDNIAFPIIRYIYIFVQKKKDLSIFLYEIILGVRVINFFFLWCNEIYTILGLYKISTQILSNNVIILKFKIHQFYSITKHKKVYLIYAKQNKRFKHLDIYFRVSFTNFKYIFAINFINSAIKMPKYLI